MELMSGYKRSDVGMIPEDWDVKPLSEVADFLDGCRRPVKDSDRAKMRGDIPYYGASGIVDYVNSYLFDEDLILLGEDGENILSRNCRLAFKISGKTWVNNHAHVLRPKEGMVLNYLVEFLESRDYAQYNTGTAQPKLNKLVCSEIPVLCPSPSEQRAIAQALSDVDSLLAALNQLIAKKRDLKQAVMQQLLTGKTRLPRFSGEWQVKRLGELVQLSKIGINPSSTPETLFTHFSLPAFDANETPVVETGACIGSNKFLVPQDAVLLSKLNPRIPRIWAPLEVPINSVCSTEFLVLKPNADVDRKFLKCVCLSPNVCMQMELHAIGTTGSHQRIQPNQAMSIEVVIPEDPDEQTAIATVLSEMDAELSALEARRDKTRNIKQAMMQELLTGKTRLMAKEKSHV